MKDSDMSASPQVQKCSLKEATLSNLGRITKRTETFDSAVVTLVTFPVGARWTVDAKPTVGTDLCPLSHVGYVLSGNMTIEMADGERLDISPGDAFAIQPGHDAWSTGDEDFVFVEFTHQTG